MEVDADLFDDVIVNLRFGAHMTRKAQYDQLRRIVEWSIANRYQIEGVVPENAGRDLNWGSFGIVS